MDAVETKEKPVDLLDAEALKMQDNLTADQEDALQAQILKELENAETPEDKSTDSVAPVIEEDEPEDKPEGEEAKPAPEKDTTDEQKPEGEKPVEEFDKVILQKYAEDLGAESDDVQKIVDAEKAICEKYKQPYNEVTQPFAKAYRNLQSKTTQDSQKLKAYEEQMQTQSMAQTYTVETIDQAIQQGQVPDSQGRLMSEAQVLEAYRNFKPKLTEDMEDDKVRRLAAEAYKTEWDNQQKQYFGSLKTKSKEKRLEILQNIPEVDKEFLPEIRSLMEATNEQTVVSNDFTPDRIIRFVKGGKYDALRAEFDKKVKEARLAGIEEGKKLSEEKPTIIGEKAPVGSGKAPSKGKSFPSFSENQKQRMYDMFDGLGMSEEQMKKDYIEIHPDEFK